MVRPSVKCYFVEMRAVFAEFQIKMVPSICFISVVFFSLGGIAKNICLVELFPLVMPKRWDTSHTPALCGQSSRKNESFLLRLAPEPEEKGREGGSQKQHGERCVLRYFRCFEGIRNVFFCYAYPSIPKDKLFWMMNLKNITP